jgi:hypothetical protein
MRLAVQDTLQAATLQLHCYPSIQPNTVPISPLNTIELILSRYLNLPHHQLT